MVSMAWQDDASSRPRSVIAEEEQVEIDDEAPAHVATESSLLFPTNPNDQVLQPSIFTMHSTSLEEEIEEHLG